MKDTKEFIQIDIEDFIELINGDNKKAGPIKLLTGKEIKAKNPFPLSKNLGDDCEYILVENIELVSLSKTKRISKLSYKPPLRLIFLNSKSISLEFEGLTFGTCHFYNAEFTGGLVFNNCVLGSLNICHCTASHLKITNTASKKIYISNSITGNFETNNSRLGKLEIDKSTTRYIRIVKSQTATIRINNSTTGYIYFLDKTKTGTMEVYHSTLDALYVKENYFGLKLSNCSVPVIELEKCHISFLEWNTGVKAELTIKECFTNILKIASTIITKDSSITVFDSTLCLLDLSETLVQGNLILRKLKMSPAYFEWLDVEKYLQDHYENEKEKSMYEQRKEALESHQKEYGTWKFEHRHYFLPVIILKYTSLGKTELTDFDLENTKIEFFHSKVSEIFLSGVDLNKTKITTESSISDFETIEQEISFFSQIKKVFESQGDIFETTYFHAKLSNLKIRLLRRSLSITEADNKLERLYKIATYRPKKILEGSTDNKRLDYITLQLNKLSNNHGESWGYALKFILLSSVLMYIPYIWTLKYEFAPSLLLSKSGYTFLLDIEPIKKFGKYYFSMLNPIRPFDYLIKNEKIDQVPAANFFWDFLSRIVISYGIYQFVVAFRRHSRK